MKLVIEYRFVDEQGNVVAGGGMTDERFDKPQRLWGGIEALRFGIMRRAKELSAQSEIIDGNATAAGMNRLLDGKDVKDTVKYGSEKV